MPVLCWSHIEFLSFSEIGVKSQQYWLCYACDYRVSFDGFVGQCFQISSNEEPVK
jgi:hypothetical protein